MAAVISNQDYAAGGPFAYVREGGTAAWSRHRPSLGRARLSGRKMYPNNTMRAELESRLRDLNEKGSNNRFIRKKAVDLEEMLTIATLQKKLKRQRFALSHCPSSKYIQECVQNTEAQLAAAVDLHLVPAPHLPAPAVVPAPGRDPDPEADELPVPVEDVQEVAAALPAPGLAPALEAPQDDDEGKEVREEALQAGRNSSPIFKKFKEDILEDKKKLLDYVKSSFKKKNDNLKMDDILKEADMILATAGKAQSQDNVAKEFMKPSGLIKKFSVMSAPAIMATVQLLQMIIIMMLMLKVGHIEYRERNDFGCVDAINKVDLNGIALAEIKEDIMTFLNGQVPRVPCCDCGAIINRVQHNHPTSVKSNEDNVASLNGHIRQTLESVSSVPADADVDNEDEDEMEVDKVSDPPIQYNAEADPGKVNNLRVQHIAEAVLFIIIIATRGYFSPSSVQIQGRELSAALDDAVKKDPDPGKVSVRHKLKQKNDDNDVNKKVDDEKKETGNNAEKMQDDNVKQEEKEDTETEADEKKKDYLDDKAEEAKEIPNTNAKRKLEEIKESRMKENGCKLFRKFVIEI